MEKIHNIQEKVDTLTIEKADQLLRKVFNDAGLKSEPTLTVSETTRTALLEALNESTLINGEDVNSDDTDDIVKLSLKVFANDPVMIDFLTPDNFQAIKEKPTHFNIDSGSFITTTTLALVVLSTYVNIKRDPEGKWTFQFRIKNSSESLKKELINLAQKLLELLPKK